MKKLLILLLNLIFLTGCQSYIELNDLKIINAIGIEFKDNNYTMFASIVDEVDKETMQPNTKIYEIKGNSLNQLMDELSLTLNKKIYLSHLDLLLINETIKTKQLESIINFFVNNNETREDFLVASTSNIKEILEKSKFKEINDLIEINHEQTSKSIYTRMYDLINSYYNKENIYLTKIDLEDNLICNGLTIFKNNNYKTISIDDTLFINYLIDNIENYKYSHKCSNNKYLYLNILNSNTNQINKELIITNEVKIITNDCNLTKDEIDNTFKTYLKENLEKKTNKKITIKNTIRGIYEN